MIVVLLIAGICAVLAGLLAIAIGIPVQEFSFGNTLILAGVVAVCSGMLVLVQAVVVRELRNIARRLGPRAPADARLRPVLAPVAPPTELAGEEGFLFPRDHGAEAEPGPSLATAPCPPWREEGVARDRTREEPAGPPPEPAEPAPLPPPRRRHLMFSSSLRKDRDLAQPRGTEAAPSERSGPAIESTEGPLASFEDAWPRSERPRESEAQQRRAGRGPSTVGDTNAGAKEQPSQPARGEDHPLATVIKSGVVDGMAYSLYSDGSIEAQMPEGLMRFATIDELRTHLDQRS
jgi:hypothetical protein